MQFQEKLMNQTYFIGRCPTNNERPKVTDISNSNSQLNSDLTKISKWAFLWKMSFNPDQNKPAIEVCFSNKRDKGNYSPLHFNSTDVQVADGQKHLGLVLNSKLNVNEHIESKK